MNPESERPIPDTDGYGQLCAVGFALDAIGDRWTMLVLRDLARSPLRFRDLQAINPGMSPNLLTMRLRKLSEAGLISRTRVAHGGNSHLYALTDDTRDAVMPVLRATAELGSFLIDRIPLDELAAMDMPAVLSRQMTLNGEFVTARNHGLEGYFVLDMSGIATHITIDSAAMTASRTAPEGAVDPVATLTFFPPTELMRIMGQIVTPADAEASGTLHIDGNRDAALDLLKLLTFA